MSCKIFVDRPMNTIYDCVDTQTEATMTTLKRTGSKGQFVLYPSDWPPQFRDPVNRRYQTKCDMLVGRCACGNFHRPEDADVQSNLNCHEAEIESISEWRERNRATINK